MTDLTTVADGAPARPSDQIMLIRGGQPVLVTIAELATTFQGAISLAHGTLLGRISNLPGGPQALTPGLGVAIAGTELLADGADHLSLNLLQTMDITAEMVVNSAGQPARLPFSALLAYLQISTGILTFPSGALLDETGAMLLDENGLSLIG